MTRRDTIIIAVFINAAILVALFISAVRSKDSEEKTFAIAPEMSEKVSELPLANADIKSDLKPVENPKSEIRAAEGDEVDLVLKQFAQSAPQLAQAPQPEALSVQAAPAVDFAQDLQALMLPTAPQVATPIRESAFSRPAIEVVVRKGDALEKIARANKTTVSEIMRLNGLKNANLKIGQILKITPGASSKKASAPVQGEVSSPKYYTVKNGDNPWTIAVKNHLKVEELLRLNNMDEQKARHLKPGDQLRIK